MKKVLKEKRKKIIISFSNKNRSMKLGRKDNVLYEKVRFGKL